MRRRLPYWAQLSAVAIGRRLRPHDEHACVIADAFDRRGVIELRWLPKRQMYSLWFCLEQLVYADIKSHILEFAAGVDALLIDVDAAKSGKISPK